MVYVFPYSEQFESRSTVSTEYVSFSYHRIVSRTIVIREAYVLGYVLHLFRKTKSFSPLKLQDDLERAIRGESFFGNEKREGGGQGGHITTDTQKITLTKKASFINNERFLSLALKRKTFKN